MGEAPFDKRSSEDAFVVARGTRRTGGWRACARAVRAGYLDTESNSSDAAADEALASFVEGEGGPASDAYAVRWCLFHMKRSSNEGEAVAVACAVVRAEAERRRHCFLRGGPERSSGSGHVAAVRLLGVVAERHVGGCVPLVEQVWQLLVPRANASLSRGAEVPSREQAAALGRAADGSDGCGWGGAVSD